MSMDSCGSEPEQGMRFDEQPLVVQNEWEAACEDAAFGPDEIVFGWCDRLDSDRGEVKPSLLAMFYRAGWCVERGNSTSLLHGGLWGSLTKEGCLPQPLILHVRNPNDSDKVDVARAIFAARLRHELEHARHFDKYGQSLSDLNQMCDDIIKRKAGGLKGGCLLYNMKPTEMDANAAAAMYLKKRFPDQVESVLASEQAVLARSLVPPESLETLRVRMICFLFQFADICEDYFKVQTPDSSLRFIDCLERVADDLIPLWKYLSRTARRRQR